MLILIVLLSILKLCVAKDAPIIGIIVQPSAAFPEYDTVIVASYAKFLETAGARVIPVWNNQTKDYYERVVNYTNGVLFPGGGASLTAPGGYGDAATQIYKLAQKSNDAGNFYPIWGTCLGLEVIPLIETGIDLTVNCLMDTGAFPLTFEKNFRSRRLFKNASKELIHILSTENVTYNLHKYCVTQKDLKKHGVYDWITLTTNFDKNGLKFISTMEHKTYPFYAIQYHPETASYEFSPGWNFSNGANNVQVLQYFANFFINESRKNSNRFPSNSLELKSLIYNYCPKFSGKDDKFYQVYGFYQTDYQNNLI